MVGLLAADLDGDGACEVIAADQARQGRARLVAYRGDGSTLWEKAFPQINGALPVWNVGALTFWWPGHFRQSGTIDLFVNTRRRLMHSDVGQLLDGRDATTFWTHDKAVLPGQFRWAWAAYGEPLVYDFNADGRPEVLLDSPYLLALLDLSGKPLWHGPGRIDYPVKPGEGNVGQTTASKHALADFDGDGRFEIASAGYGDGVRAIDPQTGKVLSSLPAPAPTGPRVTSVNIDGQGGDEILYPAGNTLVAVTGDRTSGRILWTWQGPTTLSLPAIADMDGDGSAEILVQDAHATLHCLDAAEPP